jgi:hypothetical protein
LRGFFRILPLPIISFLHEIGSLMSVILSGARREICFPVTSGPSAVEGPCPFPGITEAKGSRSSQSRPAALPGPIILGHGTLPLGHRGPSASLRMTERFYPISLRGGINLSINQNSAFHLVNLVILSKTVRRNWSQPAIPRTPSPRPRLGFPPSSASSRARNAPRHRRPQRSRDL